MSLFILFLLVSRRRIFDSVMRSTRGKSIETLFDFLSGFLLPLSLCSFVLFTSFLISLLRIRLGGFFLWMNGLAPLLRVSRFGERWYGLQEDSILHPLVFAVSVPASNKRALLL